MPPQADNLSEPTLPQVRATLDRAIRSLADSQRGLRDSIARIHQSLRREGTRGALHADVLVNRLEHLQRLACMSGESAMKLAILGQRLDHHPEQAEAILQNVLMLARSVDDQLRSERNDARNLLRLLHGPRNRQTG